MFEELNQHRQAVEEQIQKGFEIGFTGNELEKAHNVGDIHPNGKWVWTQLPSGKFDWRVIKKNADNAATAVPQATANGKKSWDNLSDFYKNGSDERKIWMEWDRFEKTGDPNIISNIRKILEKKFPNVSSWKQYAPNTNNSSKLVAVGADGKEIASIDFGGKGVDLPKLQTFMDACDKVKKESSISQQQEDSKGGDKVYDAKIFNGKGLSSSIGDNLDFVLKTIKKVVSKDNNLALDNVEISIPYGGFTMKGSIRDVISEVSALMPFSGKKKPKRTTTFFTKTGNRWNNGNVHGTFFPFKSGSDRFLVESAQVKNNKLIVKLKKGEAFSGF
jgi:hypothetical protein